MPNQLSQQDEAGTVKSSNFPSARRSACYTTDEDESTLISHQIKPSLEMVGETELDGTPLSLAPSDSYVLRTPAGFETYALRDLEKNSPPPRKPVS